MPWGRAWVGVGLLYFGLFEVRMTERPRLTYDHRRRGIDIGY